MVCIEKLVECIEKFNKGEIDADTSSKIAKQILEDEFDDEEFLDFAIDNYSEMFGYISTGRVNIRIHRDIEGPPNNPSGRPVISLWILMFKFPLMIYEDNSSKFSIAKSRNSVSSISSLNISCLLR